MSLLRGLAFVLLTVFVSGPAQADLTKRDKILAILEAQQLHNELLAYADETRELIEADARQTLGPKFDEKTVDILFDEIRKSMTKHLDAYIADLANAYSGIFTEEEVDAAYDFRTSEIGRSISAKWPRYSKENARLDAFWLKRIVEDALAETSKSMED